MLLTQEAIEQIANDIGRSAAQRNAVVKALALVNGTLEPEGSTIATPKAPTVIFVCSGNSPSNDELARVFPSLDAAAAKVGPVEIVTLGNFGCELKARTWAKRHDVPTTEFGLVWHTPNPDGTTTYERRPVPIRNQKLVEYAARAERAAAVFYGAGTRDQDKWARSAYEALVDAGVTCRENPQAGPPQPSSAPPAPVEDPAPSEDEREAQDAIETVTDPDLA